MADTNDANADQRTRKSDDEWRTMLSPLQYEVTRHAHTEEPHTGEYDQHFADGTYQCVCCGAELFESDAKFDAGCGWPSFDSTAAEGQIAERSDTSHGMQRTEVICTHCAAHLGHVFNDGPTDTGLRYCINSAALKFKAE